MTTTTTTNPGPAVTISGHPQQASTGGTLRLLAVQKGLSVAALGDTAVPVINSSLWVPVSVIVANANNAGTTADVHSVGFGVYTAASQGGTAILTNAALTSNTSSTYVTVSAATTPNTAETVQNLYFNVATATATATVDAYVYGYDLTPSSLG